MILLHIEHSVSNFEAWKAAFDSDPVGRRKMGVRSFRISRATDDPSFVTIELEFGNENEAQALLAAMRQVWQRVAGTLVHDPRWRVSELVEERTV